MRSLYINSFDWRTLSIIYLLDYFDPFSTISCETYSSIFLPVIRVPFHESVESVVTVRLIVVSWWGASDLPSLIFVLL